MGHETRPIGHTSETGSAFMSDHLRGVGKKVRDAAHACDCLRACGPAQLLLAVVLHEARRSGGIPLKDNLLISCPSCQPTGAAR